MPYTEKSKQVEYRKKWYAKNKTVYRNYIRKAKKKKSSWFTALKASLSCEVCKENRWPTLDFHHRDPTKKDISISKAIQDCWSQKKVLEEIDKCIVLCANCHRIEHAKMAGKFE